MFKPMYERIPVALPQGGWEYTITAGPANFTPAHIAWLENENDDKLTRALGLVYCHGSCLTIGGILTILPEAGHELPLTGFVHDWAGTWQCLQVPLCQACWDELIAPGYNDPVAERAAQADCPACGSDSC